MKKITLFFILMISSLGFSQNNVGVIGTAAWTGYANVFALDGTTFMFGGPWALAQLKTVVTPSSNTITLSPNFNAYNATDSYWSNGAIGNKIFEGSTFVENSALAGQILTFSGNVASNTLASGYTAVAFIKGLNPANGYSADVNRTVPLVAGQPFTVTTTTAIPAGLIVQYGFIIKGLNGNPANESALGNVVVTGPPVTLSSPTLPIDFESSAVSYAFTDFDGGVGTKIANPNSGGINTSANVGKIVKGAGQPWAGSYLTLAAPIDFSANKIFKVKVYSPRVGAKLNLKVEGAVGVVPFEREVIGTVANAWEEMTFDYQAVSTTTQYTKLVFMFDKETVGDASANFTFLIDDIRLIAPTGPVLTQMNLPVTFDDSTVNYNLNSFGGTASSVVVDPTSSTNKVGKVIKNAPETWAGSTLGVGVGASETGFSSAIPFTTTERRMNVRVWSPTAGIPVRLKVEVAGQSTQSVETEALTTVANDWQTMEFNFNNQATGTAAFNPAFAYNKASIFFNFGVAGSGQIYYFDDMKFGAAVLGVTSFEASNIRMYPNPTSTVLTIEANNVVENVTLYNVLGQQVLAKTSNSNSVTLDVANLQTGVYIVKTMIGGVASTSRLVKN
jgi:hypothetical protein